MKLFSLKLQAEMLMIRPILLGESEHADRVHLDDIDNFVTSLGKNLPDKYKSEWQEIYSSADKNGDKNARNALIIRAHELLHKLVSWIDTLGKYRDSPSARSGQLTSIFTRELPELIKQGKDRKFIKENAGRFFDVLAEEFPRHAKELNNYKKEFLSKCSSLWYRNDMKFLKWCESFGERVTVFFDNYCLDNEYEWHIARLRGTGNINTRGDKPAQTVAPQPLNNEHKSFLKKIWQRINTIWGWIAAIILGLSAIVAAIHSILTNSQGIKEVLFSSGESSSISSELINKQESGSLLTESGSQTSQK